MEVMVAVQSDAPPFSPTRDGLYWHFPIAKKHQQVALGSDFRGSEFPALLE
jgi:hypothetical protein